MSTERCVETTTLDVALDPESAAIAGQLEVRVHWEATPIGKRYQINNVSLEISADTGLRWRRAPDYLHDLLVGDALLNWCEQKTLADDYARQEDVGEPMDGAPEPQEQA